MLRAEAQKQATILDAEGKQQATVQIAQGDTEATKLRNEALITYFKDMAITFKQLETISKSLKDNARIIVPQGNAISLILSELENTRRLPPIPISNENTQKPQSDSKPRPNTP
jgi:regulator of protease activity HflC (stomatin/prohibitin superfamily)